MQKISEDLKNHTFSRVYLLFGNEDFLILKFRKMLCDGILEAGDMNRLDISGEKADLQELRDFTDTAPFLADVRLLTVDGSGFFKGGDSGDFLYQWISTLPETAVVVFTEKEVDKRSKLFKYVSKMGTAFEYNHPTEEEIRKFTLNLFGKEKINIRQNVFDYLISFLPLDYAGTQNDLEKLFSYCKGKEEITKQDIDDILPKKVQDQIFKMIEEATMKKRDNALNLYYDLLSLHVEPMKILVLLTKEIYRLYMVKRLGKEKSDTEQAAVLGCQPWLIKKISRLASGYSTELLYQIFDFALSLDARVKSGDLTDKLSVELLLFKVSEKN